jgi:hypothetical protein
MVHNGWGQAMINTHSKMHHKIPETSKKLLVEFKHEDEIDLPTPVRKKQELVLPR